jgi:Ca2+-binding RTX toxin-like protein
VRIDGSNYNIVAGNYIGTDKFGTTAVPNAGSGTGDGVALFGGARFNQIGTNSDGINDDVERNVIAGNARDGVLLSDANTSDNTVAGNWIGLKSDGLTALGNGVDGVAIVSSASFNRITSNVVAASVNNLIGMFNTGTIGNVISGNKLGTDKNGTNTTALGSANRGVFIGGGVTYTQVGTNADGIGDAGEANIIAGNATDGVIITDAGTMNNVVAGNLIGNTTGTQAAFANRGSGVLLTAGAQLNYVGLGGLAMGQSTTISLNPKATYLLTSSDPLAVDAVPINLASLGIHPGDLIALEELGNWSVGISSTDTNTSLGGVFSTSNVLLASSNLNRVQGAIAAGTALSTGTTVVNGLATDIPQDFTITTTMLTVPTGAAYLFVAVPDTFYGDNNDPDKNLAVRITPFRTITGAVGANTIAGNLGAGVAVTTTASANTISANSIYNNGGLGIDLGNDGVTRNDVNDADGGPNTLLNAPVVTSAVLSPDGTSLNVQGFARPGSTLEFFKAAPDPSGFGEGQTLVSTQSVPQLGPNSPGSALDFNGVNQSVTVNQDLSPQADLGTMTLSAWVNVHAINTDANGQAREPIIAKGFFPTTTGGPGWEYALYIQDNLQVGISIWQNSGSGHIEITGGSLSLNAWHHVAGTYDRNGSTNLYLDGVLVATAQASQYVGSEGNGTFPIMIGARQDGQFLDATIDDVRIWDQARSQQQIQAEMNGQLPGVQPHLILYLPFNEGSGTTTTSLVGGYVGTLGDGTNNKPAWVTLAPTSTPTGTYSTAVGADTTELFTFTIPVPVGVTAGTALTATATLGGSTSEFSANVTVAQSLLVLAPATQSANEGTPATFDLGSINDANAESPWTVDVNWGDGSAHDTVNPSAPGAIGTRSHTYVNDGIYTVTETVTNKDNVSSSASFPVMVAQVAPSNLILNLVPGTINENGSVTLNGSFTDPATLDKHTVDIDWGDGTAHGKLVLNAGVLSFSMSHQYLDNRPGNVGYPIEATVRKVQTASSLTNGQLPDLLAGDSTAGAVRRFSGLNGTFLSNLATGIASQSDEGLVIGPDGNIYVVTHANTVLRYDGVTGVALPSAGNSGAIFVPAGTGLNNPESIAFGPDANLYAVNAGTQSVVKFDGTTGAFLGTLVPSGSGGLIGTDDMVFGPDGNLYVAIFSTTFPAILRFNGTTGAPLPSAGNTGATFVAAGAGGLQRASALVFGPDGNLYVTSAPGDMVLRYDGKTGTPLPVLGQTGATFVPTGSGGMAFPDIATFGPDGNLYVASLTSKNILRYDGKTGAFLGVFVPAGAGGSTVFGDLTFLPLQVTAGVVAVPNNLVSQWSGEGNANDRTGNNPGTLPNGATFVAGVNGQALQFNGVNQYLQVADSPSVSPTGSFTIDGWINLAAYPGAGHKFAPIISKYNDLNGNNLRSFLLTVNPDGSARFDVSSTGANSGQLVPAGAASATLRSAPNVVPLGTWTHVAGVFDATAHTLRLYVNGVLQQDYLNGVAQFVNGDPVMELATPFSTVFDSAEPLLIGAADAGSLPTGREFTNGAIDEAALYNRALSASEIQAIYTNGAGTQAVVKNVAPTAAINGAPTSSPEGTLINLTSTVQDVGPVDTAAGFTFAWSVTKNGLPFASGTAASFGFTPDDNGTYVVTFTARDKDNAPGTDSKIITVTNVSPTVTPATTTLQAVNLNTPTSFNLGSFGDPGADNPWTVNVTWGDNQSNSFQVTSRGALGSLSHSYTTKGLYTVTEQVTDKDSGIGTATFQVIAGTLVINTNDSGPGSLRQALLYANATTGTRETITFAIPAGDPGYHSDTKSFTIQVQSTLPTVSDPVVIDGTSEWGVVGAFGTPIIELDGELAPVGTEGLTITAGNTTVEGLVINRFQGDGIDLEGATGDAITANFIGTDVTGLLDLGNAQTGIRIGATAQNNTIGGTATGAGNLVSANGRSGVFILGSNNLIAGNFIGTDLNGVANAATSFANRFGKSGNFTGIPAASPALPVTGNTGYGVEVNGSAQNNQIGLPGAGNIIAQNFAAGVGILGMASQTSVRGNSIFSNAGLGIDINGDGVTANSLGTVRNGPNNLQNFPELTLAQSGMSTHVGGTLTMPLAGTYTLDFYSSPTADLSGYGEGAGYLGSTTVGVDNTGVGAFDVVLPVRTPAGSFITATATDAAGNTSEFSAALLAVAPGSNNPFVSVSSAPDVQHGASSPEGTPITFFTALTYPQPQSAGTPSYAWTAYKNGSVFDTGSASNYTLTPDSPGNYTVTVKVTDSKGGAGTSAPANVTVTNLAPTVTLATVFGPNNVVQGIPSSWTVGSTMHLTSTVTDAGAADTHTYTWTVTRKDPVTGIDQPLNLAGLTTNTPDFLFTPLDNGQYKITLGVTDSGSPGAVTAVSGPTTVTGAPLSVSVSGLTPDPITGKIFSPEGTEITLNSAVTDAIATATLRYSWTVTKDGVPYPDAATVGTDVSYTFKPNDNGLYLVTLTVDDGLGHVVPNTTTINVTNVAPTVTVDGPTGGAAGQPLTVTSHPSDVSSVDQAAGFGYAWSATKDGQPYTFAAGTVTNGAALTFTPTASGFYAVSVNVTDKDGGSTTSSPFTLNATQLVRTVNVTGLPAVPPGSALPTASEGAHLTLGTAIPNSTGVHFTYAWSVKLNGQAFTLPSGIATNQQSLDLLLSDSGTFAVTVSAAGGDGSAASTTAQVLAVNVPPTVAIQDAPGSAVLLQNAPIAIGTAVPLTANVADPGSTDSFQYAWSVIAPPEPDGTPVVVPPGNARDFSFTPVQHGTYTIVLAVTDDGGATVTVTRTLQALHVNPNVLIVSDTANASTNTQVNLTASITQPDPQEKFPSYAWTATANGQVIKQGTGPTFSYTPAAGKNVVTLVVTDDDGGVGLATTSVLIVAPNTTTMLQPTDLPAPGAAVIAFAPGNSTIDASELPADSTAVITATGTGNTLIGGPGTNVIYGDSGLNTLIGGTGTNLLYGTGRDTLIGGSGSNTFNLLPAPAFSSQSSTRTTTSTTTLNAETLFAAPGTTNALSFAQAGAAINVDLNFTGLAQTIDALGNQLTLNGQFQSVNASLFSDTVILGPTHASVRVGTSAAGNLTQYTALQAGNPGNAITISYVYPGTPSSPLSVVVMGTDIAVFLATDANGAVISKPADIVKAINANPLANQLVVAQVVGNATGLAAPFGPVHLVVVNPQNVALFGGGGDDTLVAMNGQDVSLFGGDGNDSLVAEGGDLISLFGGGGDDSLVGIDANEITLFGGDGQSMLETIGSTNAALFGGNAGNVLQASGGFNVTLQGGLGNDTLLADGGQTGISNVNLFSGGGHDSLTAINATNVTLTSTQGLSLLQALSSHHAQLFGNDGGDTLVAMNGADISLFGSTGDDSLYADGGADVSLFGGGGHDMLTVQDASQASLVAGKGHSVLLSLGSTNAQLFGGDDGDTLLAVGGSDVSLFGGSGDDSLDASGSDNLSLFGGGGDDSLMATGGSELTLFGGDGHDSLLAVDASDVTLFAGKDDSLLQVQKSQHGLLFGGTGNDSLVAADDSDITLFGGPGNDSLVADGGSDITLFGGDGHDSLLADTAQDVTLFAGNNDSLLQVQNTQGALLFGGTGDDSLVADGGSELTLFGGDGHDSLLASGAVDATLLAGKDDSLLKATASQHAALFGGAGDDSVLAVGGADLTLFGGAGNDSLDASGGSDITLFGGDGNDTLMAFNDVAVTLFAGNNVSQLQEQNSQNALLFGGMGNDSVAAEGGSDVTLFGGGGDDSLSSADGTDITLFGGDGNDTLDSNGGLNITLFGGDGNDTLLADGGTAVTLYGGAGNDSLDASGGTDVTLFGGTGDDSLTSTGGSEVSLFGGDGNDSLVATGGIDVTLFGDTGNDHLAYYSTDGSGGALLFGGAGDDTLQSSGGTDISLFGGDGNDSLMAEGSGTLTVFGGAGNDTLAADNASQVSMLGGDGNDSLVAESGTGLTMFGGAGNDTLAAVSGSMISLYGESGNDLLVALGGDHLNLFGGAGDDSLVADGGNGVNLFGGAGDDTLSAAAGVNLSLFGEDDNNTYNIDGSIGKPFAVTLSKLVTEGNNDPSTDQISTGTDTITFSNLSGINLDLSQTGPQTVSPGISVTLVGSFQNVVGTSGNDVIRGNDAANYLAGGAGNDSLLAGTGDATLEGGAGNDTLVGSAVGDTTYRFAGANLGSDLVVQPLDTQNDTLDLGQLVGPATVSIDAAEANVPQVVNANLTLTLTNPLGIANVIGGDSTGDTITGNSRDNQITVGPGNDVLDGAGGHDTYFFAGSNLGNEILKDDPGLDPNHPKSTVTLNFLGLADAVNVDLSNGQMQQVAPGLALTLVHTNAFANVVGTPYTDFIKGNGRDAQIYGGGGGDVLSAGSGNVLVIGGIPQVVYLDFNSATDPNLEHVYTQAERDAIQARLQTDYSAFNYFFTQDLSQAKTLAQPTGGRFATLLFNAGPDGGASDQLDFRNLDLGGNATINVNNLLGGPNQPRATSDDYVALSAEISAHELGHLSGLRHEDAFGPIGSGVFSGLKHQYLPPYTGPTTANETPLHIMASPDSVGTTLFDAVGNTYFGEREAVKLAFNDTGTAVAEQAGMHQSPQTAQALTLAPLAVPNTLQPGSQDYGKTFVVNASDVVGSIGIDPTTGNSADDYYQFTGKQGQLFNFEVMSNSLTRITNPIDSVLRLYDANGKLLAVNDDEFEIQDSILLDVTLPTDGTYYLEVDTFTPDGATDGSDQASIPHNDPHDQDTGNYELFVYSFATTNGPAPQAAGDVLAAGSGNDTLVGSSGHDSFQFDGTTPGSKVVVQTGSTSATVNLDSAPPGVSITQTSGANAFGNTAVLTLSPIPSQSVRTNHLVSFTASATPAVAGDPLTFSLANAGDSDAPSGATIDPKTGAFSWTAGTTAGKFRTRIMVVETGSAPGTAFMDVAITVTDVEPPLANPDSYNVPDFPIVAAPPVSVLANDTDPAQRALTAVLVQAPTHGTLTLADDGTFTYLADAAYAGPDSFIYQARNSAGAFSTPTTVTINVVPTADPPTIAATNAEGTIGTVIPLNIAAALTDGDGSETLSIRLTGLPGDATLSAGTAAPQSDGTKTWTLAPSDLQGLTVRGLTAAHTVVTASAISRETANGDTATTSKTFNLTLDPATPTVMVTGGTFKYDGTAHAASATATGLGGVHVNGNFAFTYNGSSAVPVDVGTFGVGATFISNDTNYTGATGTGSLTISAVATATAISAPAVLYGSHGLVTVTVSNLETAATPAGTVQLCVNGGTAMSHALSGGAWTFDLGVLSTNSYSLTATYVPAAPGDFIGSSKAGTLTVLPVSAQNLQAVIAAQASPTISVLAGTNTDALNFLSAVNALAAQSKPVTVTMNLAGGVTYSDQVVSPPAGVTLVINGNGSSTVVVGHSPALTVTTGNVIINGVSYTTATDSPTILLTGGTLTLRNVTVQESTGAGFADAAISVSGTGHLDLGTSSDPGHNVLNVNGPGELVHNTTAASVATFGNTFSVDGVSQPANLSFTSLVSSGLTSVYSQAVTFTATVRPNIAGLGTPAGSVAFYDATTGMSLGSAPLNGRGVATLTTSVLSAGAPHVIRATYTGSPTYTLSLDSVTQTVGTDTTTTAGSTSAANNTSPFGQLLTLTAAVTATAPGNAVGSPRATGTVDFYDTTTATELGPVGLTGGIASVNIATLVPGTHTITLSYSGDANVIHSSGTLTVTILPSVYALNATAAGAVTLSGNSSLQIAGLVQVDSNSTSAITASGLASVSAGSIRVVGGVAQSGTPSLNPNPTTHAAFVADPLANLLAPTAMGMPRYAAVNLSGTSTTSICPGIYSSIQVSGNAVLTLAPGIYVIAGGGLAVSGGGSITGNGVMIYNADSNFGGTSTGTYGGLTLSGNGSINLTPMATGPFAGIIIFQARGNTRAISLSGNAMALQGILYAPSALVALGGNGHLRAAMIVDKFQASGNAGSALTAAGGGVDDGACNAAGQLLAGNLTVYVDNASGLFTAAELDRIHDAIDAINLVVNPFGVAVTEVGEAERQLATTVLHIAGTSANGGAADGTLGSTSDGNITLVQGWNWYTGAAKNAVGAGQYDFETIVMHELGHAMGLGHSTNASSVMYATLDTGVARRDLSVADLAIPDTCQGPCALHVAAWAAVHGPGCGCPACTGAAAAALSHGGVASVTGWVTQCTNGAQGGHQPGCGCPLCAGAAAPANTVSPATLHADVGQGGAGDRLVVNDTAGAMAGSAALVVLRDGTPQASALTAQNGGSEVLVGGSGDDLVVGSPGRDVLVGGFGSTAASGVDRHEAIAETGISAATDRDFAWASDRYFEVCGDQHGEADYLSEQGALADWGAADVGESGGW